MLVREVMSSPAITVRRADPVRRAIRVLYAHDITAAPVVDDSDHFVGVVSELDLLRGEFGPDPRATVRPASPPDEPPPRRVMEVMTGDVVTVTETTDVTTAIDLMVDKRIKSLPVVRGDAVVGMLSRRDLMAMLARPDEDLRQAVIAALREQYPSGPSWDVAVHDGVAELTGPPHENADHIADHIADLLARTVPGIVRVRNLRRSP
ncbi:CBS domain-containing protein [Nonomuraea muscovyensis]|uniref:CBS domain-containing protein n=1 Tax=Nonomuraea muscovyensis TaxID=1124761 RepID=A0A7X0C3A8_9ACTN|nr:CBS domain-containing protein [Nonomuraea muscovyensis]MBB6347712.1 CBS domain-containing protein [Nonomuraea muscovyensis]